MSEFSIYRFTSRDKASTAFPDAFNKAVSFEVPLPGDHFTTSSLDNKDKYTTGCLNCIGLICAGDKGSGEAVSFMMHVSDRILETPEPANHFNQTLNQLLFKLGETTITESRLAAVVGGDYTSAFRKDYRDKVKLITDKVLEIVGVRLLIAQGPKVVRWDRTDVFYSASRRLLVIAEDSQPAPNFIFPFPAKDIDRVLPYSWSERLSNKLERTAESFFAYRL